MHINVIKWGNSLGVRIPRVLANKLSIHEGTPVDVSIRDRHIVISKEYSLKSLVDKVTSENIHEEIQVGHARGKES